MDPATELGPLATEQILDGVHNQIQKSIAAGAKLLTGGNRIYGPGFFYEPTVLIDVHQGMRLVKTETFGPVLPIMRVRGMLPRAAQAARIGAIVAAWRSIVSSCRSQQ